MKRALRRVQPCDHALIDGRPIQNAELGNYTTIVDGDASSYAIACASIVAKVRRDRFMRKLAQRYPAYAWERNVGYGTQQHRDAMQAAGVTQWHRRSYAPVRAVIEQLALFSASDR
jgi:ribonuclease HII